MSVPLELRLAVRGAARRPGFAAATVLILAVGIGTATAVYSIVQRVLLRPLAVADIGRLVVAWETSAETPLIEVSLPYFHEWRARSRSFDDMAAFGSVSWRDVLRTPSGIETVEHVAVSASFFDTLRARPRLGRGFVAADDELGAPRVAVLSHGFWRARFAGDPNIVGTHIVLGDDSFRVVGVMSEGVDFPKGTQLWTPVGRYVLELHARESHSREFQRGLGVLYVVARLKDGVPLRAAETELAELTRQLSIADAFSKLGWGARIVPLLDHHLGAETRRALEALGLASLFILLLACANVAALFLVRAIGEGPSLAIRRALGASAGRVALHQLAQSAVLSAFGGALGTLIAYAAIAMVVAWGPAEVPGLRDVRVDGAALGFALLVTFGTALLVAAPAAIVFSRTATIPLLKSGERGGGMDRRGWSVGRVLVASEVALSLVLLVGSSLVLRSLSNLLHVELGFVPDRTLSFTVKTVRDFKGRSLPRELIERLDGLPGVEAAGAVHVRPLEHGPIGSDHRIFPEGHGTDAEAVRTRSVGATWQIVTPDYFRAIGTRLVDGRAFSEADHATAPKVVILSESAARRLWPGRPAIGRRVNTGGARWDPKKSVYEWQTVVGVVEDARYRGLQVSRPDVYVPYEQAGGSLEYFVLRTTGDPALAIGAVREQVRALDPAAAVERLTTMRSLVDAALAPWRFTGALLLAFATAALVLTASGLCAVLHHFVARRTREIAIRMALGAQPGQVRALIVRQGAAVAAAGVAVGLAVSVPLSSLLAALRFGVAPHDAASSLGAAVVLAIVAAVASFVPARRATLVQPVVALRSE